MICKVQHLTKNYWEWRERKRKRGKTVEIDPQKIHKFELTDDNVKIMLINPLEKIDDNMKNFTRDLEFIMKNEGVDNITKMEKYVNPGYIHPQRSIISQLP